MSLTEKPQKIFISLDDSIPYVLDLINSAHSTHIILVVEESSGVISTLVSMKILLREIIKLDKVAVIQTRDRKAVHFGGQVGFVVVEQTSDITPEIWKEAERANDTFKSIYASRKDDLATKRKSEVVHLGNNLQEDSVWKQNLPGAEENVNFDDVVDIPVISTIAESEEEITPKDADKGIQKVKGNNLIKNITSPNFTGSEKTSPVNIDGNISKNERIQINEELDKLVSEKLESSANEVIIPNSVGSNLTNKESFYAEQNKYNLNDFIPNNEISNGSVNITAKEVRRPSFEELYRQAKEKKANKEINHNSSGTSVSSIQSTPRRYVPKLIRNSGLVIAPGGDLMDFEEVNSEIIKDDIDFKTIIHEPENQKSVGNLNHSNQLDEIHDMVESKKEGRNSSTDESGYFEENFQKNQIHPKQNSLHRDHFVQSNQEIREPQYSNIGSIKEIFGNLSTKVDLKKTKEKVSQVRTGLVNFSKKSVSKIKNKIQTLKQKNNSNKTTMKSGRQQIPNDPLLKSTQNVQRSKFIPIDRKKLVRNTFRIMSIILLFLGIWAIVTIYFLINAQVVLAVTPISLSTSKNLEFKVVNETLITDNTSSYDKSAQKSSEISEIGESLKTTKTKDIGLKAEGNITLYNKTDADIPLKAGNRLQVEVASKNFNFFLKSDVVVPKRIVKTIRTDNGFIDARVIYEFTGTEGNIPSELLSEQNRFAIEGFASTDLEGISFLGFSGGTNNIVKIISQEDLELLKKNVENKIKEDISNKLKTKFSLDFEIITPEIKYEILKQEYTGEVGGIADKVDLFMKIKGEVIVIDKNKIKKIIDQIYQQEKENLLRNRTGEPIQEKTENWTYNYEIVNVTDTSVTVMVKLTGKLLPPISMKEIKQLLVGKSEIDARNVLGQLNDFKIVGLTIRPDYLPELIKKFPNDPDRVNLVFEKVIL